MNNKYLFKIILMILFTLHSSLLFAVDKVIIEKMPQDLQDFFESADACEVWVSNFDPRLEKITYNIVESVIKENCSGIEHKLSAMKNKYKNNKDYSARLTVYDDTIIIYGEYKKTRIKNKSNE
ncbi:hypothetical protein ACXZAQ_18555 [Citrobacter portucalensis]|uniref:hypothetical protein n=1 Tax=Citrobacter portucalensis TaxID=1639133 RepID=UPI001C6413DE|nr:hypothetical protein [Citrobacter portucalensis]MBW7619620.1 hypothetical protein [Citrobacter portucalensis]MBW7638940.1 hypothetical protein [Citrobacter portucalensis]MCA2132892.1 hypothetical protein [Citrobacter portucalensis]MCA2143244.1 hypothetical protein [Citrobacter portucalensis]MCA2148340.1 hypothetical protein [Citrobacter portucalensis]